MKMAIVSVAGLASAGLVITGLTMGGCVDQSVHEDGGFPEECVDGDESVQRWGTDCICCHEGQFSMAGSIAKQTDVVEVRVSDGVNQAIVAPNHFGNFFRHVQLTPPLSATLVFGDGHEVSMKEPAPDGACNRCHDGDSLPRLGEVR